MTDENAVSLPLPTTEGHHWQECNQKQWLAVSKERGAYLSNGDRGMYYRLMPDALPHSNEPGAHLDPVVTPAERLRAAADALDTADNAATPAPWIGKYGSVYPETAPHDALADLWEQDANANAALIATLRALPGPVAAWLRRAAFIWSVLDVVDRDHALAVADAVLGGES